MLKLFNPSRDHVSNEDWLNTFSFEDSTESCGVANESFSDPGSPLASGSEDLPRGCFFKVIKPQKFGELHLCRLLITNFLEGNINNKEWFTLVLSDFIERVFNQALRNENFRKKWKPRKIFDILERISKKALVEILKPECSFSKARYLLENAIGQFVKVHEFKIPHKNRDDSPLGLIKIIRHMRYYPPRKQTNKKVSNSARTKGSLQEPGAISWQEVAAGSKIFENGKFITPIHIEKRDPGGIGNV